MGRNMGNKPTAPGKSGSSLLTGLLVGSEGTLAVITKIRLKVLPLPQDVITLMVLFKELEQSGVAVTQIISEGIIPRTLEFLDRETIKAVEDYKPIGLPDDIDAMLLIELDGAPSVITIDAQKVSDICGRLGGEVIMAENDIAREKLWESRRAISPALFRISPTKINEDIVVPRTRLPEMLRILKGLSESTGIRIVNFGHAGDGNIHVNLMVDKNNKDEYAKALKLVGDIFSATLELGGTISGEHGVGLTKKDYITLEIQPDELELMKKIKAVIINVTGYAGVELARLLYRHPGVELCCVTGRSEAGKRLGEVFPHLEDIGLTITDKAGEADIVFSALPHKASAEAVIMLAYSAM